MQIGCASTEVPFSSEKEAFKQIIDGMVSNSRSDLELKIRIRFLMKNIKDHIRRSSSEVRFFLAFEKCVIEGIDANVGCQTTDLSKMANERTDR